MVIVTNHELRKKLAEVQRESRIGIRGISSSSTPVEGDSIDPLYLEEKRINRVQGEEFIATDDTRGKLFFPMPCLKWRCTGVTGPTGMIHLEKELTGLFVTDGTVSYLLGVWGDSSEFEIILSVGSSEIRVNDLYISQKSDMFVRNGLEEEQ